MHGEVLPYIPYYVSNWNLFVDFLVLGAFLAWVSFRSRSLLLAYTSSLYWMSVGCLAVLESECVSLGMSNLSGRGFVGAAFLFLSIIEFVVIWYKREKSHQREVGETE
jgi:hypothetical protein